MQELLDQILDYLKGIWLKRRYIIICTWLICPLGWLYVAQLDSVYESEARVYADTQSILGPLLKGLTVATNPNEQIRLMSRTLLSRNNLEKITRMADLDIHTETSEDYEKLIQRLKEDIIIRKQGGSRENIFTISYQDKDPDIARVVVQSALNVFIENTLGENRSDTDSAQRFLDSQISDYENRLLAAEAKLTDFKQKYSDVLPNQFGGYYEKLNLAKEQLKAMELSMSEIRSQLKETKSRLAQAPSTDGTSSSVRNNSSIRTTFDERIAELESALDALKIKYTDEHPDIREASRRLDYLNKQREKEIEDYLTARAESSNGTQQISENPVIQNLQIQVNSLQGQLASMQVRRDNYKREVEDLENKIHILPEIEAELTALNRDYGITKKNYEALLARKETAKLAKEADETTSNIQFRVIDQPRAASEPIGPKRILFTFIVLILGLGAGTSLSLGLSQINPVVTSGSQVAKATGIPVFGVVSAAEHLGLQKWHLRKRVLFIFSNAMLLGLMMCFIVYAKYGDAVVTMLRGIL